MKKKQKGSIIVEFDIIAAALFIVLFAVIDLARHLWIWNTAAEATRRGARVAAVCPIDVGDHSKVHRATVFADISNSGPATSPILRELDTGHVDVFYLDEDGTDLTADDTPPPTFENTRYVRVSLSGYPVKALIPFIDIDITLPPFETTIPSESLGLVPPDPDIPGDTADFKCVF